MKKNLILGLLVCAITVPSGMASQVKTGSSWGSFQNGVGGEFALTSIDLDISSYVSPAGTATTFQTFCVENSIPAEYINLNTTYNVTVNTAAVYGGNGGGPLGDPLSSGTGWLYQQFATGQLAGYFTSSRQVNAGLLQNAFWWLEDEAGLSYNPNNIFMKAVVDFFGSEEAAKADGAAQYGVYALNMTTTSGARAQDQLYYSVPDGGLTLMLLGMGMSCMTLVARRIRN
jgi:hypothetical protein